MWRTRVGYAGGLYPDPTYRRIGDHTECFQVDFDPEVISYGALVDLAFASHNPTWKAHKMQYASLVLAHDDEQLATATERGMRVAAKMGALLATRIEPLSQFWLAEDYHQKYYLRNERGLAAEFSAMFEGDEDALRDSTAAARVNGYVAGDGTRSQLAREIDFLGLTGPARTRLIARVGMAEGDASAACGVG
ncbi:MAG: peptide-methionine (S)-S-oxide reductase [Coriobacteriia bacterium]|nr:peptide-methionine (S)-S-oxide reductase [Coriobacteriia bacterium]